MKIKNPRAPAVRREAEEDGGLNTIDFIASVIVVVLLVSLVVSKW